MDLFWSQKNVAVLFISRLQKVDGNFYLKKYIYFKIIYIKIISSFNSILNELFKICIYLLFFQKQNNRHGKEKVRGREEKKRTMHLLIHSPSGHKSQDWAKHEDRSQEFHLDLPHGCQ